MTAKNKSDTIMAAATPYKFEDYEPVESIPEGVKWRPQPGQPSKTHTKMISTPGAFFRLERNRDTGEVRYFRLKDMGKERTPKDKIDAEPTRGHQVRYRVGTRCWFVEANRWFLVEVVDRLGGAPGTGTEKRIVIKPVDPLDADKQTAWPYSDLLEFPAYANNQLFQRLRPLKDRYQ